MPTKDNAYIGLHTLAKTLSETGVTENQVSCLLTLWAETALHFLCDRTHSQM